METSGDPVVITDHGLPRLEVRRYAVPNECSSLGVLSGSVLRHDHPTAAGQTGVLSFSVGNRHAGVQRSTRPDDGRDDLTRVGRQNLGCAPRASE